MFGYFRFFSQYSDYTAKTVYKNYYCGLCFALDLHYGPMSRMLLSYDTTILAIALHAHLTPQCDRIKCVGCKKTKKDLFSGEDWKKAAAINILLAAEKLRDDITDERSLKATVGSFVFKKCIQKAQKDYPQIHAAIRDGYTAIVKAEAENASVLEIADAFGALMTGLLDAAFVPDPTLKLFVREISRWLYFIDALDDYDEDLKKKRFNPLARPDKTFREFVSTEYTYIASLLEDLYAHHSQLLEQLDDGTTENDILISILKNTIPAVTGTVLNGNKLPALLHFKSGTVWRAKT